MPFVLVSSPGCDAAPHWSHAFARELAALLVAAGDAVTWLAPWRSGQPRPAAVPGVELEIVPTGRPEALPLVAAASRGLPMELVLTRCLRRSAEATVVHVGAGARGSPNVAWLAERLGAPVAAVVRGAEVVCHRGDLVDREAHACAEFLDAARCRRCCAGWWRAPRVSDLQNRSDLLAASLAACRAVFVPVERDVAMLTAFGVAARSLVVAASAAAVAAGLPR